eukprot:TRINITY_DN10667_c0_g1_i17.p1 TRINITY_DN10667_c0_g1~~TRINITY_DN10667_c0_g1_i17.p1  ORF type:complete len:245 (+),score=73.69 TRINITY_DN10667_c0_g1_i17:1072-1806(+)
MNREEALQLIEQKDKIEKRMAELNHELDILKSSKNIDGKFTDREGFPREDLNFEDLISYKNFKRELAELQTDYGLLMKKIEKAILIIHEIYRESGQAQKDIEEYENKLEENKESPDSKMKEEEDNSKKKKDEAGPQREDLVPFARITEVTAGSPAAVAGFQDNDLMVYLGRANYLNHNNLELLRDVIMQGQHKEIPVTILREDQSEANPASIKWNGKKYRKVEIQLTPRPWEGRGIVGCRFIPL